MIVLASQSPRRKELLSLITEDFKVCPAKGEEVISSDSTPEETVMQLAYAKAEEVRRQYPDDTVIGSDTIVVYDGQILGKPADENDAFRMLKMLSGHTHSVFTGTSVLSGEKENTFFCETKVTFYDLTDDEIKKYMETKEPYDKAGAYGIQGYGALIVKEITGDYYTVMGLSVGELSRALKKMNVPL